MMEVLEKKNLTISAEPVQGVKKILFLSDHFYPAWKLGGTLRSLKHTVKLAEEKMDVYVITSAYDLHDTKPMEGITLGSWQQVGGFRVRYLLKNEINFKGIGNLLKNLQADTVYINGMFSVPFTLYPLIIWKKIVRPGQKIIVAPRGMLQEGALSSKRFKKRLYLKVIKMLGLHRLVTWHATDEQERRDVYNFFGQAAGVKVVADLPAAVSDSYKDIIKNAGELKLVYLSLVAEKKNLLLALKLLKELALPVVFDIYGPVKDESYWAKCRSLISSMPEQVKVNYRGLVMPSEVGAKFSEYHAMLFPTKGENFGHVIYECLGAGRPVIISNNTPWKSLYDQQAGYTIEIHKEEAFKNAIRHFFNMDQQHYDTWMKNAHAAARDYWDQNDFRKDYLSLLQ